MMCWCKDDNTESNADVVVTEVWSVQNIFSTCQNVISEGAAQIGIGSVSCPLSSNYDWEVYCKTLFFRRILILRCSYAENSLHFNLADFPVNGINNFFPVSFGVSAKFYYHNSYHIIVYITYYQYILHYIYGSVDILCRWTYGDGQLKKFACI